MRWNHFTKWWLLWGLMFLVIETQAIRLRGRRPGGTLSSLVWRFIDPTHPYRRAIGIAILVGLMAHFIFHWLDY